APDTAGCELSMPLSITATLTPRPVLPPRICSRVTDSRSGSAGSGLVWAAPPPQLQAGPSLSIADSLTWPTGAGGLDSPGSALKLAGCSRWRAARHSTRIKLGDRRHISRAWLTSQQEVR